jgi:hypothetical protein
MWTQCKVTQTGQSMLIQMLDLNRLEMSRIGTRTDIVRIRTVVLPRPAFPEIGYGDVGAWTSTLGLRTRVPRDQVKPAEGDISEGDGTETKSWMRCNAVVCS